MTKTEAIVGCRYCGVAKGESCRDYAGFNREPHPHRIEDALALDPLEHASDCAFRRRGYKCNCAMSEIPREPSASRTQLYRIDEGGKLTAVDENLVPLAGPSVGATNAAPNIKCVKCSRVWPDGMCSGCVSELIKEALSASAPHSDAEPENAQRSSDAPICNCYDDGVMPVRGSNCVNGCAGATGYPGGRFVPVRPCGKLIHPTSTLPCVLAAHVGGVHTDANGHSWGPTERPCSNEVVVDPRENERAVDRIAERLWAKLESPECSIRRDYKDAIHVALTYAFVKGAQSVDPEFQPGSDLDKASSAPMRLDGCRVTADPKWHCVLGTSGCVESDHVANIKADFAKLLAMRTDYPHAAHEACGDCYAKGQSDGLNAAIYVLDNQSALATIDEARAAVRYLRGSTFAIPRSIEHRPCSDSPPAAQDAEHDAPVVNARPHGYDEANCGPCEAEELIRQRDKLEARVAELENSLRRKEAPTGDHFTEAHLFLEPFNLNLADFCVWKERIAALLARSR